MPKSEDESSDEFLDSEEESEQSTDTSEKGGKRGKTGHQELKNQPFDEALELSDNSVVVSEGGHSPKRANELKNQPYDEALELSSSIQSPIKASQGPDTKFSSTLNNSSIADGNKEVKNKPFDEQVELSDSDSSVETSGAPSPKKGNEDGKFKEMDPFNSRTIESKQAVDSQSGRQNDSKSVKDIQRHDEAVDQPTGSFGGSQKSKFRDDTESGAESSSESESDEESTSAISPTAKVKAPIVGAYDEQDYAHLHVSQEIKELFQYIGRYKSQDIEIESKIRPFIPEYIPSVGEMDMFLKIPRPDKEQDDLGLKVLDEPSLEQSDATVLDLQLRSLSKKKHGDIVVRSIENAEKNPKEIDRWVKSIADLHRSKPPPQVHYTKSMPDIETLMQVWPEDFEDHLSRMDLPSVDIDLPLEMYIRMICGMLDIPVYKNISESLHVLFTLYSEFRSNQHFMNYEATSAANPEKNNEEFFQPDRK